MREDDRFDPQARPAWVLDRPLSEDDCRAAFEHTSTYTVGIEEELMLLDPGTLDLEPAIERALDAVGDRQRFRKELRAAQIEIVTPVCETAGEAGASVARARRRLIDAVRPFARIAAAGTHPFSTAWGRVTHGERYRLLAEEYSWAAKRASACGLHVHVAVPGAERSLAVYNALRSYLPEIGALAANSPFFEGHDTGLSSMRPKLNEAFPREGVPPAFASWTEFVDFLEWGRAGGSFPDATFLWWELRPHPAYGTLELRTPDCQTKVEDASGIAALFQALAVSLAERHDGGEALPVHDTVRISENFWRALRYGLGGHLVDVQTGEATPTRARVGALLEEVEPVARRLRSDDELAFARALVGGNGADRQRYVAARDGVTGVVRWLVEETDPGNVTDDEVR